jgi:hypothetical protein
LTVPSLSEIQMFIDIERLGSGSYIYAWRWRRKGKTLLREKWENLEKEKCKFIADMRHFLK